MKKNKETKEEAKTCDWCGNEIENNDWYYANGNCQGCLCKQCHIQEMIYSNDKY